MKKLLITLSLVAVVAASYYAVQHQRRRAEDARQLAAVSEQKLREAEAEATRQQERAGRERTRLLDVNAGLAEKINAPAPPPSPPAPRAGETPDDPRAPLAKVLKDPDMKEVLRKQGREAAARNVKQLVTTNLIQQLGLNDEQATELKNLLTKKAALGFDFMLPIMTGELDDAALSELGRQTKTSFTALDGELKSFLGEERFQTLRQFELTQPERDRVSKFAAKQAEGGQPLAPGQREQLLAALAEERRNFQFAVDYNDTDNIDYEHFHDYYADARLTTYFGELDQLNQRFNLRAEAILPPEQAVEFKAALKEHLQKSKYVVKTTNALFGKRPAK